MITQIEGILNSRPIIPPSSDANDPTPLTPAHFLIGDSLTSYPDVSVEDVPTNRLSRWEHVEKMRQHFWRRWQGEYLNQLQQRNKWITNKELVKIDHVILIKDDNSPHLSWPLDRIIELHPRKDGIVRVVTVRTSTGSYLCAITNIYLLPVELEPSKE